MCVLLGIETSVLTELNLSPFKMFSFETAYCSGWSRTHSVSQTGLELAACLPYPPDCWYYQAPLAHPFFRVSSITPYLLLYAKEFTEKYV